MKDINGDRESGVKTIPVILGTKRTRHILLALNCSLLPLLLLDPWQDIHHLLPADINGVPLHSRVQRVELPSHDGVLHRRRVADHLPSALRDWPCGVLMVRLVITASIWDLGLSTCSNHAGSISRTAYRGSLNLPDLLGEKRQPLRPARTNNEEGVLNANHTLFRIDHLGLDGNYHALRDLMVERPQHRILVDLKPQAVSHKPGFASGRPAQPVPAVAQALSLWKIWCRWRCCRN